MKALTALAIAIQIGFSPAAIARTETAPTEAMAKNSIGRTTKTESALACLLGLAPSGCEAVFEGATLDRGLRAPSVRPLAWKDALGLINNCTWQYVHKGESCSESLETVQYLGTNAAGGDVYEVDFKNKNMTYVISPPGPDGKIPSLWIFDAPQNWVLRRSVVTAISPVRPAAIIYRRKS